MDILQELAETDARRLPIIFLTGHGHIPMSVRAMRAGAVEALPMKPFRAQEWSTPFEAPSSATARCARSAGKRAELRKRYASLTSRERDVLMGSLLVSSSTSRSPANWDQPAEQRGTL